MDASTDPAARDALAVARGLLRTAGDDALTLLVGAQQVADATDWQSRATDDYRRGVAALVDELRRLVGRIDRADDECAAAQSRAGVFGGWVAW